MKLLSVVNIEKSILSQCNKIGSSSGPNVMVLIQIAESFGIRQKRQIDKWRVRDFWWKRYLDGTTEILHDVNISFQRHEQLIMQRGF